MQAPFLFDRNFLSNKRSYARMRMTHKRYLSLRDCASAQECAKHILYSMKTDNKRQILHILLVQGGSAYVS